jgi:hypothetical protein
MWKSLGSLGAYGLTGSGVCGLPVVKLWKTGGKPALTFNSIFTLKVFHRQNGLFSPQCGKLCGKLFSQIGSNLLKISIVFTLLFP